MGATRGSVHLGPQRWGDLGDNFNREGLRPVMQGPRIRISGFLLRGCQLIRMKLK